MEKITCPKCGTENLADAVNCKQCRVNLEFALENPGEIERIKQPTQGLSDPPPTDEPGKATQDGIYCSVCGHLNPSWRSECEKCRAKLSKPGRPVYSRTHDRPGCVTAYAVLLGIGAGLAGVGGIAYGASEEEFGTIGIVIVVAALEILLAIGLWRLKNWARIIVIVLQSLSMLAGVIGLLSGNVVSLVGLAVGGYILYWFASHGEYFE